jgi:hypothetical protein
MSTYIKIASNTVAAGGVASVTFSSIPATYTDLIVKGSVRSSYTGTAYASVYIAPNGAATLLSAKAIYGSGSGTPNSANYTSIIGRDISSNTATASTFGSVEFYIPNYASANLKSVSIDTAGESNVTAMLMGFTAGLWSSTTAISSLVLTTDSNFMQYTSFTLYGISNA